jgi:rubrerythrin
MYARMAKEAREEGFTNIADLFDNVGNVEKEHEARYRALAENMKNNQVFDKEEETIWICLNCGHIHRGKSAPAICPTCTHPKAYFALWKKDY